MTREPIVLSVPHTGTRFLKTRLDIAQHVHANSGWRGLHEFCLDRPAIYVPLRRPHTVWRSWCRRHYNREPLDWVGHFMGGWFNVNALDHLFELDFIAVDKCDDPRITDWSPVGEYDGRPAEWSLHKIDLRILYTLPFVKRIYGEHTGD